MYKAEFSINGWAGVETHTVCGENASELLADIATYQDLDCLVRMGQGHETGEGKAGLKKLTAILRKDENGTLTIEDLSGLSIKLSVGTISISEIRETNE